MNQIASKLEAALEYQRRGFSVIPLKPQSKVPIEGFSWTQYQKERAMPDEIKNWFNRSPDINIGIVCGAVSGGLICLDVDPRNGGDKALAGKHLPITPTSKTGGNGLHYYFSSSTKIMSRKLAPGLDLQAEGKYVVAPPSVHPSGQPYEWMEDFGLSLELARIPDWMTNMGRDAKRVATLHADQVDISNAICTLIKPYWKQGARNDLVLGLAGYLGKAHWTCDQTVQLVSGLAGDDEELASRNLNIRRTYERLSKGEEVQGYNLLGKILPRPILKALAALVEENAPSRHRQNKATELVEIASEFNLFHDSHGNSFAAFEVKDHREIWPVNSSVFHEWIAGEYYQQAGTVPDSTAVQAALYVISGKARYGGRTHVLHNRVAEHEGAIYYDLADEKWRAIKITPDGYELVERPPILFRRHAQQRAQVEPKDGGSLQDLMQYLNINSQEDTVLLLAYIVACLVPDISHPILVFAGEQGSAKSTQHRIIRRLLDPSSIELLSLPDQPRELAQLLEHHWIAFFDNQSGLSSSNSNMLCRAVTGESFVKRKLFSDEDDIVFSYRRCIGLNGINVVAQRPDLLERTLLFKLARISPDRMSEERKLLDEFEAMKPRLFGAVLWALSVAMRLKQDVQLRSLNRLADFTIWACAAAQALGYSPALFHRAYAASLNLQNEEALSGDPVAGVLISFMRGKDHWRGTASSLLQELRSVADEEGVNTRSKYWPGAAHALTRRLNVSKTNLRNSGIEVDTDLPRRQIALSKTSGNTVNSVQSVQLESNDGSTGDSSATHALHAISDTPVPGIDN